jgi:hypothetical protein
VRGENDVGVDRFEPVERGEGDLTVVVQAVECDPALSRHVVEGRQRVAREQDAALGQGDRVVPCGVAWGVDDARWPRQVERRYLARRRDARA